MGASDDISPVVPRRRLRTELKKARLDTGQTQSDVAAAMDWSLSKVIRIEAGTVSISTNDLKMLLRHYKVVDPARTDELLALGKAARDRTWWSEYRDVASSGLLQLIGYESAASARRNFEPLLIPGLLQTREFARAVIRALDPEVSPNRLNALVELRMKRQELVDRTNPPQLSFILDEAAIHRMTGGPEVMQDQLRHLMEVTEKPNVTIEILPFSAGVRQGMRGSFVVLAFPDAEDDDVLYVEDAAGGLVIKEDQDEIQAYREIFESLGNAALKPKESVNRIARLAKEFT
jgi:transcriptional regulator with XRE-family HTH domain